MHIQITTVQSTLTQQIGNVQNRSTSVYGVHDRHGNHLTVDQGGSRSHSAMEFRQSQQTGLGSKVVHTRSKFGHTPAKQ